MGKKKLIIKKMRYYRHGRRIKIGINKAVATM